MAPLESRRFGIDVGRLEIGPDADCDIEAVMRLVDAAAQPVVVLRVPAAWISLPARLARGGRVVIHADGLMYWSRELDPTTAGRSAGSSRCATPSTADRAGVEALARAIFTGYASHYAANPLFRSADIAAGYAEWAGSFTHGPDRAALIVDDDGTPGALATVELAPEHGEVCLAGVAPRSRGRGIYARLMMSAEDFIAAEGRSKVVISTQVHNVAVQRAWVSRDYRPAVAFQTLHLVVPGVLDRDDAGGGEASARSGSASLG